MRLAIPIALATSLIFGVRTDHPFADLAVSAGLFVLAASAVSLLIRHVARMNPGEARRHD